MSDRIEERNRGVYSNGELSHESIVGTSVGRTQPPPWIYTMDGSGPVERGGLTMRTVFERCEDGYPLLVDVHVKRWQPWRS